VQGDTGSARTHCPYDGGLSRDNEHDADERQLHGGSETAAAHRPELGTCVDA
jgi:hypothetical protein